MGAFSVVPIRGYDVLTDPSWWNALRAAGLQLESFLGVGAIYPTFFNLANNQVAAADVTGFLFPQENPVAQLGFQADYVIYRYTTGGGATELVEHGTMTGAYLPVAGTWTITRGPAVGSAGITFSITAAGQIQYTSTNISGTPASSYIIFRARTLV